jgi:predicted nuclease with TOPRIM domain
MGGTSEREFREKLSKILENANKGAKDVREKFANIQKIKVEALKKTEEMKRSADQEIDKTMINITKSQDLAAESKTRLQTEISDLRTKTERLYTDLKKRISETMVPAQTTAETYA